MADFIATKDQRNIVRMTMRYFEQHQNQKKYSEDEIVKWINHLCRERT